MLMKILTRSRALTMAGVVVATAMIAAQAERPLPPVALVADGTSVMLPAMALEGQWLIVSVAASSPPSTRLLDAMSNWELGPRASRLLVVAESVADAEPLAAEWAARLPGARWAADPKGEIARSLNLRGAPMVIGVRGREIVWTLAGVLNDPGMLHDITTGWLGASP